ncbi:MAG: hypothetical protein WCT05_05060 [Lentisphaeria bacterium]
MISLFIRIIYYAITRQHLKRVTNLEAVARMRFKAGVAPHSAAIQAQVELGTLDERLEYVVSDPAS